MDLMEHRRSMIHWLEKFVSEERYRKLKYLNIYYPKPLGKPFLKEQRYCVLVDDFEDSPVGIIDFTGYHYVKKDCVHGETSVQVDNLIHATQIYQIFKCLKETLKLRLSDYNITLTDAFRQSQIVDSFCDIIINEYEKEIIKTG